MIQRIIVFGFIVCLIAGFGGQCAVAQGKSNNDPVSPTREEMMVRMEQAMTPGDAQKKLEAFVGTWNAKSEIWSDGPASPPTTSEGTATYTMVYGGRFLREEFTGDMMNQPFTGLGFTGYDNFKGKYVGSWIDNMSTSISTMEGDMDPGGKVLTMWGKMDEPATGQKDNIVKYVMRVIDKDKYVFEVYDVSSFGESQPMLRITYTRKA